VADYLALKELTTGTGKTTPPVFDEEQHPLPGFQELIDAGWPKRRDRLARAILAAALKQGGNDLADGGAATRASILKREYHHLFPEAHLARLGMSEDQIYRSLNCALVTWRTNRTISAKAPERYLTERRDANDLGEQEIRARLATHLIPYDEMVANDYAAFLNKRAILVHEAMVKLAQGGT
jgi:hypothetical protein